MEYSKEGQTLEESRNLIRISEAGSRKGDFEDWVIPPVITDFKKQEKENREKNTKRVEFNERYRSLFCGLGNGQRTGEITEA